MKFGCLCIFKHISQDKNRVSQFEERILLTEADSYEKAEEIFQDEFEEYGNEECIFLNEYEIFEIDETDKPVIEVASSMKVFNGTNDEYLDKYFYDQRPLSCDDVGWQHSWYNKDGKRSGCYNCQEIRDGKLWQHV